MLNSILTYLINNITSVLPPTRFYKTKSFLYKLIGWNIDLSSRIVSSANFWGTFDLSIGADTFIGHDVLILGGNSSVKIGSNVDIAPRVTIVTGSHYIDMRGERSAGSGYSSDIIIEDGVWVGAGSTIIGGITIGRKSIVGSGSLVNKSIPPNVIAVGNPCRPIKCWNSTSGWKNIKY